MSVCGIERSIVGDVMPMMKALCGIVEIHSIHCSHARAQPEELDVLPERQGGVLELHVSGILYQSPTVGVHDFARCVDDCC